MEFLTKLGGFVERALGRIIAWIGAPFAWIWRPVAAVLAVVRATRFPAYLIAAGYVLLLATDQGRELATSLGDDGHLVQRVAFVGAVLWWAFQSWWWARVGLELAYGVDRAGWKNQMVGEISIGRWITATPRLYAVLVFGLGILALYQPAAGGTGDYVLIGVVGLGLMVLLIVRARIERRLAGSRSAWLLARRSGTPAGIIDLSPLSKLILTTAIVLAVAIWLAVILAPVGVGQGLGGAAIAFLAFSGIAPVGSYLVLKSRNLGFPVILFLAAVAFLFSPLSAGHHRVRPLVVTGNPEPARPAIDAAIAAFEKSPAPGQTDRRPIVFISTAGGGLRAAYWTATVLGHLQDQVPDFHRAVFSISGVSGGSLGAVIYAAALADSCGPKAGERGGAKISYRVLAQDALSRDYLAPTVAALLYTDVSQALLPFVTFIADGDRAAALEQAWEKGWARACNGTTGSTGRLAGSFLKLWPESRTLDLDWRPALFLNGTHQETGKRIITSNLKVTADVFSDTFDFYALSGRTIRASTAALNSARFPYVTPAGGLGAESGHILDGGYFENFGAETTAEIAAAVLNRLSPDGARWRPVFIEIASDPELDDADAARAGIEPDANATFLPPPRRGDSVRGSRRFANELFAPIDGFSRTREARGVLAAKNLADMTRNWRRNAVEPVVARFRLCPDPDGAELALGWVLSSRSREAIDRMLTAPPAGAGATCNNAAEFEKVRAVFGPRPTS